MSTAEQIVNQVRAALEHEPHINLHRFPVQVGMADGDLILEGEVETIAAKKRALRLASAASGVVGIVDRLHVVPAQRMGDGAVRDHVCNALVQEPILETCRIRAEKGEGMVMYRDPRPEAQGFIEVTVEDGVVTLNGSVPSLSHKRLAGVLAWWVPGSREVINGLEVVPPEEDNDDELTDAVRLALEKDPLVEAGQIRVSTAHRVVTLEGLVANAEVKNIAEFDAWYTFGVDDVINKIETRR